MTDSLAAGSVRCPERGRHATSDGRSGVILMETLLVLPILLMLLGGLFVVGDLLMGRLVAHELDRALAWRAKDRFGPTDFDVDAFSHIVAPHGITAMPGLYAFEMTGSGMGNKWCSVFAGRSDVQVDVPWWVALVNTQDAVMGDPEHPDRMESAYKLNSDEDEFTKAPRSYVMRRKDFTIRKGGATILPYPTPPSFSFSVAPYLRGNAPSGLRWLDIVCDMMAGSALGSSSGGGFGAYNRNENAILVSGDPGP